MIKLINLTKDFKTTLAVNRLNLEVAAGEIYGFIGPNGAGKTTTIRMMGGIIEPTDGKILIGGIDMSRDPVDHGRCVDGTWAELFAWRQPRYSAWHPLHQDVQWL